MNISYIANKEIDKVKWDNCIANSHNGIIYTYSWYLDIVSPNWDALINNDYSIVFPLTCKKKYGIQYLYQPIFSQQLGIFSKEPLTEEIFNQFLKSIPDKFKFIEINLNIHNYIKSLEYENIDRVTYQLNLHQTYENIRNDYSENTVRNIKKTEKNNIIIKCNNRNIDQLVDFFINTTLKYDKNITKKDYNILNQLVLKIIEKNIGQFYSAFTNDNILCACIFFVNSNNKSIYLFSSADEYAKKHGIMHKLIDTYIKSNSNKNIILDFEGSNILSLARFYASFGAKKYLYLHIKKNNLSKLISWIK